MTDGRGPVPGLRAADFEVTDAGSNPSITVDEQGDAPLDLVLVAQPLPAVAFTSLEQAQRMAPALSEFLGQIEDQDRLGAILASAPPVRLRALEFGRPDFDSSVFDRGSEAAPFDAIAAALGEFNDSQRRRALVAFVNGTDFRSTISFEVLAELARQLGPAFILITAPARVEQRVSVRAEMRGGGSIGDSSALVSGYVFPPTLEFLARRTGGVTVNLGSGNPSHLIEEMFRWLRTRYVISYEPPAGSGWHSVSVKVNHPNAKVTAREGYFVQ